MSGATPADRMRRAVRQIRREGYKIAVVYAVVDAAVMVLLTNLLVQVLDVPSVPERLPLPDVVVTVLGRVGVTLSDPTVTGASVVALVAGLLVFVVEVGLRSRRPLVEQFEAANPEVREALRTARDAVEDGVQNRITTALYEDVLERLRNASSAGLLDFRRVAGLTGPCTTSRWPTARSSPSRIGPTKRHRDENPPRIGSIGSLSASTTDKSRFGLVQIRR